MAVHVVIVPPLPRNDHNGTVADYVPFLSFGGELKASLVNANINVLNYRGI